MLALALGLALGGIYVVDRNLSLSRQERVQVEATEAAQDVEELIALHVVALQVMSGVTAARPPASALAGTEFQDLMRQATQFATSFERVWLMDSVGAIRAEYDPVVAGGDSSHFGRLIDPSVVVEMSQHVRVTGQAGVSTSVRLEDGTQGFVIAVPLYSGHQVVAVSAGIIPSQVLVPRVKRNLSGPLEQLVVLSGSDTIASANADAMNEAVGAGYTAPISIPGGASWTLRIVGTDAGRRARFVVWLLGVPTLFVLLLILLHERRQSIRLAERAAELERLSVQLLRANRSKSEFLANVSHELRTPLNAIVGFVDLLRDGVYGDLNQRQTGPVDRVAASANHLRRLVDQILDIAKLAAGRLEMHREPVDLRPFVLDVASEVEALITERGLHLSLAVGAALPRVRTDPTHLRQILVNLLGNAVKYTPAGSITVRGRLVRDARELPAGAPVVKLQPDAHGPESPGAWVALQVADSGIGIAVADLERIFEEFEQIEMDQRVHSMQRGTGLGLPISRRLARLLGGDITVESQLGKGSVFTLWLPITVLDMGDVPAQTSMSSLRSEPLHGGTPR